MKNDHLVSSYSPEWETPWPIFNEIDQEFHFTLDPCATDENHKCNKYYTKKINGLIQSWANERVFVNPPYGHEIGSWIKKSYIEFINGAFVVMLIPSRTDTRWWHEYCMKGEIRFVRGRIGFINRELPSYKENGDFKISKALFPSAIIIFGSGKNTISSYKFEHESENDEQKLFKQIRQSPYTTTSSLSHFIKK